MKRSLKNIARVGGGLSIVETIGSRIRYTKQPGTPGRGGGGSR